MKRCLNRRDPIRAARLVKKRKEAARAVAERQQAAAHDARVAREQGGRLRPDPRRQAAAEATLRLSDATMDRLFGDRGRAVEVLAHG